MSNAIYIGSPGSGLPAVSLPDGYTQLAYVASDGTQYINTGLAPDNNTRVVCDVVFPVTNLGTWLFGARPGGGQYCFLSYQNQYRSDYANSADDEMVSIVPTGRFTVDKNKNVTYINGEIARTAAQSTFSCTQTLYLFACNQSNSAHGNAALALYSCKIYDDNWLMRNYVPCKNPAGTVGLYDTVNSTFSEGSGGALIASLESNVALKVNALYVGVDGLARKVVKGYIGAGGLARLFYSAAQPFAYTYTGGYTEAERVVDGVTYTVLTLTSSGTLSVTRAISADVWLCGGGGNGASGNGWPASFPNVSGGGGGGGGYIASANVQLSSDITCVIGAAAGATSLGSTVASAGGSASNQNGGSGASGGGGTYNREGSGAGGSGDGSNTVPAGFGVSDPHCAGGGAGGFFANGNYCNGGAGGSNGGNGGNPERVSDSPTSGGVGGTKGGGAGGSTVFGNIPANAGHNATFYGGGGGGGGQAGDQSSTGSGARGSGYQGVIYIRWKKEDAA